MKTNRSIVFIMAAFMALVFGGVVNGAEVSDECMKDSERFVAEMKKLVDVLKSAESMKVKSDKLAKIQESVVALRRSGAWKSNTCIADLKKMHDLEIKIAEIRKNPPTMGLASPKMGAADAVKQLVPNLLEEQFKHKPGDATKTVNPFTEEQRKQLMEKLIQDVIDDINAAEKMNKVV